jgi:hypothetical protein
MNDNILTQLKTIVERAVRPVAASRKRKRQMREELLAHLTAVFQDEQARLGDDAAALAATRRRFGPADTLVSELQRTVPRWDRIGAVFDKLNWEPGESLAHLAGKHALATFASYAVLFLLMLPGAIFHWKQNSLGLAVHLAVVMALVMSVLSFVFVFFPTRLAGFLYGDARKRAWRQAIPYLLFSLVIFPAFAFLPYWALTGDLAASLRHARFACLFAPAAPLLFSLMGRAMFDELRYEKEWASLEVDD